MSQDQHETEEHPQRNPDYFRRYSVGLILLAIVTVCVIIYLKGQKVEVKPRPQPAPPAIDYGILINTHADQARGRNGNALRGFELNIKRILTEKQKELDEKAAQAAKEAASYKSCCAIVYYMAWDKVKGDNKTETFLNEEINPVIEPSILVLAKDIDEAVQVLENDLRQSTLLMAKDLVAIAPTEEMKDIQVSIDLLGKGDFDSTLKNFGFNTAVPGVLLVFDVKAIYSAHFTKNFWTRITSLASRLFGKQVVKLTASAGLAAADGPIPIGDILAIGGIIWTGYDINSGRKEFEKELLTSTMDLLGDARGSIHKQAVGHANSMVKAYQELQDGIGSQTINNFSRSGP